VDKQRPNGGGTVGGTGDVGWGAIGFANTNSFSSVLNGFTDVFSQSSSCPASDGTNQTTLHLLGKMVTSTGTASSGGTISSSRPWAGRWRPSRRISLGATPSLSLCRTNSETPSPSAVAAFPNSAFRR